MIHPVALDTGPLVAALDESEQYHDWCCDQFKEIKPPLLSCEAVISEACFLLESVPSALGQIEAYLQRGIIKLDFSLKDKIRPLFSLMKKYADVPMSLADACLVSLAEANPGCLIFTLDSDFKFYRFPSRRLIPVLMPE
jgi:uncharacterized protein